MKARVFVKLRESVLDPQGKAVLHGLESLGFSGVEDVRVGKLVEITFSGGKSRDERAREVGEMCEKLLANTVIEDYHFDITE